MIEVFPARSGDLTATVAGTLLHSRYDPRREAARFLDAGLADRTPATLLLVGAGLGYLATEARTRFPAARIILVSLTDAVREEHAAAADDVVPVASPAHVEPQLQRLLRPADVAGLELLEWEPAVRAAPRTARAVGSAVREIIARRNAEIATTAYFGRRYMRNAVRGALVLSGAASPKPAAAPVCIAASGPGLERAAPWIARNRPRIELWALSSAWEALSARGLEPDLVIHQDAGYYAGLHLAAGARQRRRGQPAVPVLMPLTAALPPGPLRESALLLSLDTKVEADLCSAMGREVPRVAEAPTVAATATRLALALTDGTVYMAGLDLCREDIRAHARPHAFEPYFRQREHRLAPLHSRMAADTFDRSAPHRLGHTRTEPSLDFYASWFRGLPRAASDRLRRVAPSAVDIGIREAGPDVPAGPRGPGPVSEDAPSWQPAELKGLIERWAEEVEDFVAGAENSELAYLVSAPDYVAIRAARRRRDRSAETVAAERLRTTAAPLFSRLLRMVTAMEAQG